MDDKRRESGEKKPSNLNNGHPSGCSAPDEGRRRFAKGLAVSAPVIMTLAGRPVWAARNCSESGQLSGNLSDELAFGPCGGEGCSPGFWKNNGIGWHYDYPTGANFNAVFRVTAFEAGATLEDVILGSAEPLVPAGCGFGNEQPWKNALRQLGFHAVAALQNAATSVSYDLTVAEVILSVRNSTTDAVSNCDKGYLETTKTSLETLNNQICPL